MRLGLKVFPQSYWKFPKFNTEGVKEAVKHFDYIELMAIKGSDTRTVEELQGMGVPFTLHTMHFGWGVNLANKGKRELNLSALNYSQELADKLDARYMVVHCGRAEDRGCTLENTIELLLELDDKRFVVENLPKAEMEPGGKRKGPSSLGWGFQGMKKVLEATGLGMCLDFAHATESAVQMKRDPVEFMKELIKLNPVYFHISDGFKDGHDYHLHLGEGEFPLKVYRGMIPKDGMVCIETDPEPEKLVEDARFMRGKE